MFAVLVDRPPASEDEISHLQQLWNETSLNADNIRILGTCPDVEIKEWLKNRKVILLLGEASLEFVLGLSAKVLKVARGKTLYSDTYKSKVVVSFSPYQLIPKANKKTGVSEKEVIRVVNDKRMFISDVQVATHLLTREEGRHRYETIFEQDEEKFERLMNKIETLDIVSVDIEADEEESWDVALTKILGIGFSWIVGTGVYVVLRDQTRDLDPKIFEYRVKRIKAVLENPKIKKIIHNCNYEVQRMRGMFNIEIFNLEDTMLIHHLIDENARHGLDDLSHGYSPDLAGYKEESEIFLAGEKNKKFSKIPTGILARRCAADCDLALRLYLSLYPELQNQQLEPLYKQIVMPHRTVLTDGEIVGTRVDIDELNRIDPIILEKVESLKKSLRDLVGDSNFNPGSPKQVQEIFKGLGVPLEYNQETGNAITDVDHVKEIIEKTHNPFAVQLLKYRQFSKLHSTYIVGLRERLLPGAIIHTSYLVHGTVTGRLSSQNPNLQNIPTDVKMIDEYELPPDISIRKLFIPRDGYKFIVADGSQMELRLLACLSRDEKMTEVFMNDGDIHTLTAFAIIPGTEDLYKRLKEDPHNEELKAKWGKIRATAKNINFGIAYGRQAPSIAAELKISVQEAQSFLDGFFAMYPGVYRWVNQTIGFAKANGYVTNLFGRRRRLPDLYSPNKWKRAEAERQAQNSPIQGSAADVTAIANIRSTKLFKENNIRGGFRLNIHDELVYECHDGDLEQGVELINKGWLNPIPRLSVPLKVQVEVGTKWQH